MLASRSETSPVFSFAAAAAPLPPELADAAGCALRDYGGSGQSVLELPFTGHEFASILESAEAHLRELLGVPADYRVLFLQGGASAHFALLPLNLLRPGDRAAYLETGHWSVRALAEARRVAGAAAITGCRIAKPGGGDWCVPRSIAYLHITSNETADGRQLHENQIPAVDPVPLIADMTGDLFSRPIDVARYGLIYASAQKSLAAAGLTIAIVHPDLLGRARAEVPAPFNYALQAAQRSKVNTPPVFAVYLALLMLKWMACQGGIATLAARSREKSARLYDEIESSGFYRCTVPASQRSTINVCYCLPTPTLEREFVVEARRRNLLHLAGHPAIGGIRASLYNTMPMAGVEALLAFMAEFAETWQNGG